MEKIRLSNKSASKYVVEALMFIGYPESIRVITRVTSEGELLYDAVYQVFHQGKIKSVWMPLSSENYYDMLYYGLELEGIKPIFLNKRIKGEKVTFIIGYDVLSYESVTKGKKFR